MAIKNNKEEIDRMPVIPDINDFDRSSGVLLERIIFNYRHAMIIGCIIITLLLGYQATKLVFNAGFEKMLPQSHPYIKNYLNNKNEVRGLGNTIRVVVENTQGDIFDPEYLELLMQINDEIFLTPGVDRSWLKSLWTPAVRYTIVTEEGFAGGPVMPDTYDGSQESLQQLRLNIVRAAIVGSLVADNYKSSMIVTSLLDTDYTTGKRLDYSSFSRNLENIRKKFETAGKGKIKIHIIGFAKIVGALIEGLRQMMAFFVFAIIIAATVIFLSTRCVRSTILLIFCSALAVLWQLGIVAMLGFELDPYSIMVPFLVFAIGISHGMQRMNGIMQDIGRGSHKLVSARYTFRRLSLPGVTALSTDAIGFALLMLIDIPIIRDLALTASIGVVVVIFTNLILLPVTLSFIGVSPIAAKRSLREETEQNKGKGIGVAWASFLDRFAVRRSWAVGALSVLVLLAVIGFIIGLNVQIGDLDPGAPELRPDSRYNQDNAYFNSNYRLSSDQFAVIVKTPPEGCMEYSSLIEADRLARQLKEVPGVQATASVADTVRLVISGTYEASPKWFSLFRNQKVLNFGGSTAITNNPDLLNNDATIMPVIAYLTDHKAETLNRVVKVAAAFAEERSEKDRQFLLAAGSAGIEAATNIVVEEANLKMVLYIYAAVILFCLITFRSWRAVVVALIPLVLTSILCQALMVILGIGVKVATLPVTALGVGIGVDYALYLLSVQLGHMRAGLSLGEAYKHAVQFTGKVVGLVGITLAGAVVTWAWSPIKFQADMGILLAFMFFFNMIGALILIPALSHFILGHADDHGRIYFRNVRE